MRVLIIEPDKLLGTTYATVLAQRDYEVELVTTAQAAVMAADARRPDVVVLEPHMPRHNGIEFLYEFKSYSEWQTIPVVIHTIAAADKLASSRVLAAELGVTAVLDKAHTNLDELCQAVAGAVTGKTGT